MDSLTKTFYSICVERARVFVMLWLVVGCGSIGKKHIRNLQFLADGEIVAHDTSLVRIKEVEQELRIKVYDSLDKALEFKPDAALICTPTSLHISPALSAAQGGCHLFIEKPLSHNLDGIDELMSVVETNKLVTLVGCNMRFHPGIAEIKKLLEKGRIGRVLCARVQAGQYLPDWHPGQDYRKSYSASKALGGGIILDGIHELDYARWFLGEVEKVFCFAGKFSSLDIDTEDMAEILLKFSSGALAEVHLDYLQRYYGRSCQIIGEEGTILWDFNEKQVKFYSAGTKNWQVFPQEVNYNINQMYTEELKHFILCVQGQEKSMQDIKAGRIALQIALAARESAAKGGIITMGRQL